MSVVSQPVGRRERNKQDKLDRITSAARELFAVRGVDDVTTQEIADRADIGAGTLFLYAKTKGELLLLVQNSGYAKALEEGTTAASAISDPLEAVMSIVRPVVECNRTQVENGRTYLREVVFGDPGAPHHGEALTLTIQTEEAIAAVLQRDTAMTPDRAAVLAHIVSAIMFLSMASTLNAEADVDDIVAEISGQVQVLLRAPGSSADSLNASAARFSQSMPCSRACFCRTGRSFSRRWRSTQASGLRT